MESISNIQLIDASRPTSVEAQSEDGTGNNNIWTNTASYGLRLNPGDQVSVASVFINTAGAGSSSLETTGKIIDTVSYKHTKQTFSQPSTRPPIIGDLDAPLMGDSVLPSDFRYEVGPYGCDWVESKETTTTKQIKDNEFNVVVSYYKNTNGENYIHLPRKYTSRVDPLSEHIPYNEYGTPDGMGPTGYGDRDKARQKLWYQSDDKLNGRPEAPPLYRVYDDWHWYMGLKPYVPIAPAPEQGINWEEVNMPPYGSVESNGTGGNNQFYDTNMWKQKNDNSRYTIYTAETTLYSDRNDPNFLEQFGGQTVFVSGLGVGTYRQFVPSYQVFNKYRELKEYSVKKGYNDPHNVAYQLTSQFSDPKLGPQPVTTNQVGYDGSLDTLQDKQSTPPYPAQITTNSNGETFKPFAAANYHTLAIENYVEWYGFPNVTVPTGNGGTGVPAGQIIPNLTWATATAEQKNKLINSYTSYNMIGVKRPELWDAGRDLTAWKLGKIKEETRPAVYKKDPSIGNRETSGIYSNLGGPQPDSWNLGKFTSNESWGGATNYQSNWLRTRIEWDKDLLLKFKTLFEAQRFYPELLDFRNRDQTTNAKRSTKDASGNAFTDLLVMDTPPLQVNLQVKSSTNVNGIASPYDKRYLHMNAKMTPLDPPITYGGALGDDLTDYDSGENLNRQSCPIFFYFDETMKDTYTDTQNITEGVGYQTSTNLCYGFAFKDYDAQEDKYFITFNIRGLPRLSQEKAPNIFYGGDSILSQRQIGYDWHFNAYGTSAIMLYSGWVPQDSNAEHQVGMSAQGNDVVGTAEGRLQFGGGPTVGPGTNGRNFTTNGYIVSKMLRQIYLGSIDPLIQFSDANSRFTIQNLHTPEQIQNPSDAGKDDGTGEGTTVSTLPDAGDNVYKINKKLTLWNNFTPEMSPYRNSETFKAPYYKDGTAIKAYNTGDKFTTIVGSAAGGWVRSTAEGEDRRGYVAQREESTTTPANGWDPNTGVVGVGGFITRGTFRTDNAGFIGWDVKAKNAGDSRIITPAQLYEELNQNLEEFIVYDSHCGIFLEDFGIKKESVWKKSLFGIMGWSFSQFNPTDLSVNRQSKLTRVNYNAITPLTTNADIPQKDLPTQIKNAYQKPMFTLQVPAPLLTNLWFGHSLGFEVEPAIAAADIPTPGEFSSTASPFGVGRWCYLNGEQNQPQIYPEVVNPQTSMSIICENLPTKMKSPYYLIKSSIIASQANYIKDKSPLPIVAVANKENLFGDFAFASSDGGMIFTVIEPSVLTEIVTEVYDSDMSPANIDENSSVIYKIVKNIQRDPNLAQTLLKANGTPKKTTLDWNTFTEK